MDLGQRIFANGIEYDTVSAWIDTEGRIFYVGDAKHWTTAREVFNCEPHELEARGWMHLSYGMVRNERFTATQSQIDALYDIQEFLHKQGHAEANRVQSLDWSLKSLLKSIV